MVALALNGLAVVWVLVLALSITADRPRTSTLAIIIVQAVVALAIQAWVFWRIATGWFALSSARRVGVTLFGVVVAPVVSAFAIVGVVAAVVIGLIVAILVGGADRSAVASSRPGPSFTRGPGSAAEWTMPSPAKRKCSMCVDGKLPCYPCASSGYRYVDGVAVGNCYSCAGNRGVPCGSCNGYGYA